MSLLILGAAGGALNLVVARQFQWLPSARRFLPGKAPILGLGLVGSVAVGAAATAVAWVWPLGTACAQIARGETGVLLASIGHVLIGFVAVRWVNAERARAILRRAVYQAATAPAAHPDMVRSIAVASPDAIYDAVDALTPRRIEH
jgi:hypothetical protein